MSADIYYSDCIKTDGTILKYQHGLTINHLISGTISHQNAMIKRSLFIDHGFYDESFKISSDWKFFLTEYVRHNSKFVHLSTGIAIFNTGGISATNRALRRYEDDRLLESVFGKMTNTLLELRDLRDTLYFDIVSRWGNSTILEFILKVYRFFARRLCKEKRYSHADNYIMLK